MADTKFTLAPWQWKWNRGAITIYRDGNPCTICSMSSMLTRVGWEDNEHARQRKENCEANAALITTAPDGYALAQHILALETDPYLQGHPEWEAFLNEAAALVKKAEGR